MPAKRIAFALTACVLSASGASAAWNCQQDPETGTWVCTGVAAPEPQPPALAAPALAQPAPQTAPTESQPVRPVPEARREAAPTAPPAADREPAEPQRPVEPESPRSEAADSPVPQARTEPTPEEKPTAESAPVTAAPVPETAAAAPASPQTASDDTLVHADRAAVDEPAASPNQTEEQAEESPQAPVADTTAAPDPTYAPDLSRLEEGLDWAYCGPPPPGTGGLPSSPLPEPQEPILLSADGAELYRLEDRVALTGAVVVDRGNQHLEAERVDYHRGSGVVRAEHALLQQPGLRMLGREVELDLDDRHGSLTQVHYRLVGNNARGSADSAQVHDDDRSDYRNIRFSTCPPDSSAWELQADEMELDRASGRGVARDAKLRVGGVPVFYTPYLDFPLDDRRQSGVLAPSLGVSDRLGAHVGIPYYFNIAPEMDATLTPRYMSERGLGLSGEFRYLTAQERGELYGEIVPDDRGAEEGVDSLRGGARFRQNGRFGPNWMTDVNLGWVSDDTYLEDFGNDLRITSTRNIERRADLRYLGGNWNLLGRVQGFQTVDSSIAPRNRPYSRLPQVLYTLNQPLPWQQSLLQLEAEYGYFEHAHKVEGSRAALRPSIALPLRRSYGQLIPKLTLNHASYWLNNQASGLDERPSVTLPTASLDAGLVFEKRLHWLGESATQTLEPRLFYLYTPYEDQSDLPLFDTAELDFSFASLFRENRFSGRDRIGDANQLTLALTSRTLSDRSGRELFRASIGQIFYFEDRRVQSVGTEEDDSTSAVAAELAARFSDRWSGRASVLWDPNRDENAIRKSGLGLHYRGPDEQLLNLTYRQNDSDRNDDTDYEDTDLSFRWPLGSRWEMVGRWLYSLEHAKTMEAFGGIEYRHCCWRVRTIVRSFVNSPDEQADFSVLLQFELTGLGTLGSDIDEFLERGVFGYEVE